MVAEGCVLDSSARAAPTEDQVVDELCVQESFAQAAPVEGQAGQQSLKAAMCGSMALPHRARMADVAVQRGSVILIETRRLSPLLLIEVGFPMEAPEGMLVPHLGLGLILSQARLTKVGLNLTKTFKGSQDLESQPPMKESGRPLSCHV